MQFGRNTLSFSSRILGGIALIACFAGCGERQTTDPTPPEPPPASASTVATAVTQGTGIALSLAQPIKGQFAGPRRDEARVRSDVQAAYATTRFAEPNGCISVSWVQRTATIIFVDCTLPTSGEPIDGTLSLAFENDPLVFTLGFSNLTVSSTNYDGTVRVSGIAESVLMEANLVFSAENAQTQLTLTELKIGATTEIRFADGTGSVSSPTVSTTVTINNVTWPAGSCLPTSGTLSYVDNAGRVTIRFTPATPSTGAVIMQVGNLPPFTTVLFTPC